MGLHVAVIGPGADATGEEAGRAREVGRRLAAHGAVVLTGGLGGVMAGASQGAAEAGGLTVGLLPGDDRRAANPHVGVAIATGLGELRNGVLVRSADAVIAVGGSWGTLSELAMAKRMGKPVISLGGWRLADDAGGPLEVARADSPAEAVDWVMASLWAAE